MLHSTAKIFFADALQESNRNRTRAALQNLHGWIEPFGPSFITTPGLVQLLDLLLKDSDNGTRSVASLEPAQEQGSLPHVGLMLAWVYISWSLTATEERVPLRCGW